MPIPTLSFLVGVLVLGYLSTFVLFAILRIVTGVSIQRLGFSGLRRIAFSPRHGVKVNIRGIGFSIHRPTFALPTWLSLVITELVVTVDIAAAEESSHLHEDGEEKPKSRASTPHLDQEDDEGHGSLWRKLTEVKEKIKRLHRQIRWIRLVDLNVNVASVDIVGVGCLRLEHAVLAVDTRKKTVDRSRLFQHHKKSADDRAPAEWKSLIGSIFFTPEGRESTEILDHGTLNIHGMLHNKLQGLRDASISLKLGRLNIPYDDFEHARKCADMLRGKYAQPETDRDSDEVSLVAALNEMEKPGDHDERFVRTVSDSRAFIASILRGIQEVQYAVGTFTLSRKMDIKAESDKDVYFNLAMKELGLDILRLDTRSPAHRMYFSSKDVAHQGLLTAIAISAGIDDGHEHPERMMYVPMVTATVKTTLPSRTIHYTRESNVNDRNTNMLYANFVCTSPSVDLDPKHLPLIREMLKQKSNSRKKTSGKSNKHHLISQLLPKANVKFSIQEPVIRISLPSTDPNKACEDDFDLLISSVSAVSLECESSHSTDRGMQYNLGCRYRATRHQLYYQSFAGERHDLLNSDSVEVDVDVNNIPDATVTVSAHYRTFTLYLVRPDICEGVRQIVKQLRRNVLARTEPEAGPKASFLRTTPAWLHSLRVEGTDFGLELAGVDDMVSKDTRGFALQLSSWTTDYKAQRDEIAHPATSRRKSTSKSSPRKERPHKESDDGRKKLRNFADGRRLTVHLYQFEGFIIDSNEDSEHDKFMSIPQFEVAFSTSTDHHGPIFHVNSLAKSVLLTYSLYHHFALGVAIMTIKRTFIDHARDPSSKPPFLARQPSLGVPGSPVRSSGELEELARTEITIADFKSNLVQIKARMPADPPMMIQVYNVELGRHRWTMPFCRAQLARLYVRAPRTKAAWSRVVSIKALRLDIREIKRKTGKNTVSEKSIDIVTETIRFAVPHSLVVHSIFDNITNVVKTSQQLHYHFLTRSKEYILTKEPEGPKKVPRITLRSQLVLLDLEDSSFEWQLGAIYRAGLQEQKQRVARDEAFRIKERRISRQNQRGSSRFRAQSAHLDDRGRNDGRANTSKRRNKSSEPVDRPSSQRSARPGRRQIRYDAEGQCGFSDTASLSVEQAREKLHRLNAQTWKKRIDRVLNFQSKTIREIRHLVGALDETPEDSENQEPILAISERPGLMLIAIQDLMLTVDKPTFPIDQYSTFLHDVGKGMPHDMKYGLLIPFNLQVTMGELRFQLRDYPLPLLHVPPLASGQSPRLPSFSLKTDFVIAEEFRDIESQRHVKVQVVPAEKMGDKHGKAFEIEVRRTIAPVKTYSDMKIEINTSNPTKITWGTSYQPAIQDTMQVVESFTKPPMDPSDKIGFWDKIRLAFHSRVNVAWKGDGDVHLILKGSRDPYNVTGTGAGLVMVWRNDVRWNIAQTKEPRQFMTVDSGDYILAVPDFNAYARRAQDHDTATDRDSSTASSNKKDAIFKKVAMKLSGNVRWQTGLVFEREGRDGERIWESKDHYDVVLKHPDFAKPQDGKEFDAYRGFRSDHIHMSIAVIAPHTRDWSVSNLEPSNNYNSVHLTPKFFSHFLNWWSMFSGVMSLPIRQGPLWGPAEKKSKKFGRHTATIKYNLLLSPLYISHVYKHKDAEDYQANTVAATGLKMKLDSFMLDLHQRREYFDIRGNSDAMTKQTSAMRIHEAQLDFIHADLRALSASIAGTSAEEIDNATDDVLASLHTQTPMIDMSKFDIPDNDFTWIDMDDFVELDWILPAEADPQTRILPLGFAPRFTYFRQTDHGGIIAGDPSRTSRFGDEPTHFCVMSRKNDPRRVQAELIETRLDTLQEQRAQNERTVGDHELQLVRDTGEDKTRLEAKLQTLRTHGEHLEKKRQYLVSVLQALYNRLEHDDPAVVPDLETSEEFYEAHENARRQDDDLAHMDSAPLGEHTSDFNNRFIVHNAQIKWNNSLRNIILRYVHQNGQRRGFVYYMSRRAVKFILDVLEKNKADAQRDGTYTPKRERTRSAQFGVESPEVDDEETVQNRIEELLRDGRSFVNAGEPVAETEVSKANEANNEDVAVDFVPLNIYHFRLIAPQIQLQSEKNQKSAVLVTSRSMQLKVVEIMDKDNVNDDVSGLVQRRFNAAADSLQMFVTNTKTFSTEFFHLYSANLYGAKAGTKWPPWVPMEVMFEYQTNPYGFHRVVHRTSASVRYDKYNNLRLKYRDHVSGGNNHDDQSKEDAEVNEESIDRVWVEFPHFRAVCDSTQYYALYIIVMDLLLYSEPLEKTRTERLEKIMLASDFSDLTGAPEMVQMLQERIRQLEEIKDHFQVNEKYLDRQGWKDRISMDQELAGCQDELFFMMKAITTSQQRQEDRVPKDSSHAGLLHLNVAAKEIAWHLVRDHDEALVEFQLKNAAFDRYDYNDGSNYNVAEIGRIIGFNLLPDALYPEIIAPFTDVTRGGREVDNMKMLRVHWLMLEAIAGIPVVDSFEIDLVPLRVQVERDVAKKLFEYIFPGMGGNAFEDGGFSPFMVKNMLPTQEEEDEEDADHQADQPEPRPSTSKSNTASVSDLSIPRDPRPGSLEQRMRPTLHLTHGGRTKPDNKGLGISSGGHGLHSLTPVHEKLRSSMPHRTPASKRALASTEVNGILRSPSERSLATMRSEAESRENEKQSKRFQSRSSSKDRKQKKNNKASADQTDDLTQMMNRASNYMTLAFVKVPSMVLCLSYKGQGKRNIEDVHDLVFRLPTLEYRNKTWSNLDLALQLKKDVIRALISHTGAIIGNKFRHTQPSRQQQSKLRELASRSTFLSALAGNSPAQASSEASSIGEAVIDDMLGRPSTASGRPSTLQRSISHGSTLDSSTNEGGSDVEDDENGLNGSPRTHKSAPEANGDSPEQRPNPFKRRVSGFGERLRQRTAETNSVGEETEETKRKSKLLLGGQKLLRTLRDQ